MSRAERAPDRAEMKAHFQRIFKSKEYCEFEERLPQEGRNVVLTSYLVGQPDPQRGRAWTPDYADTKALRKSVTGAGEQLAIINDCFDSQVEDGVEFVRVEAIINPYFQRWLSCWQYLRDHPEVHLVFCVDATDVEMLRSPFSVMEQRLYVGDEPSTLDDDWLLRHHPDRTFATYFRANRHNALLNAGLCGGPRELVMRFLYSLLQLYWDDPARLGMSDMGVFNYMAYTEYSDVVSHGRDVSTVFKAYDYANTTAWWRHK